MFILYNTTLPILIQTLRPLWGTNGNFVLVGRRRCQADGGCELVEDGGETLVEAVEQRTLLSRKGGVTGNRIKETGGERRAEPVEELYEDQADRVSLGRQLVAARTRQLLNNTFGAELGKVVAQRG